MSASDDITSGGGTTSNEDQNFGRARTPGYQDNDAGMADMLAANARISDESHQADEEAMRRLIDSEDGKSVLGRADSTPISVESPDVFRELQKEDPSKDAAVAIQDAASRAQKTVEDAVAQAVAAQAAAAAALQATLKADGAADGQNAAQGAAIQRPLELERQLATIQLSKDREQRMVIQGDESIRIKFYTKLEAMGKLRYQGGTPIINLSPKDMAAVLRQVALENGVKFQPVAQLEYNRAGSDWTKDLVGAVKDLAGRKHQIDIFVVGDQATIDKKVSDINTVLAKMQANKLLDDSSNAAFKDGKLDLSSSTAPVLKGSRMLDDLVGQAKADVAAFKAAEDAKEDARKDFHNKGTDEKIANAAAKEAEATVGLPSTASSATASAASSSGSASAAAPAAAEVKPAPVSPYVQEQRDKLAEAFSEPGKLSVQPEGKKQITAEILLNKVRTFNPKDVAELGKMSAPDRQAFVTQLALATAMADTGTFGRKLTPETIDKVYAADPAHNRAASPSIREKVGELVAAERGDAQFEARAAAVLTDLEAKGIITREQATKAYETLAPGKELPQPSPAVAQDGAKAEEQASGSTAELPSSTAAAGAEQPSPTEAEKAGAGAQRELPLEQTGQAAPGAADQPATPPAQPAEQAPSDVTLKADTASPSEAAAPAPAQPSSAPAEQASPEPVKTSALVLQIDAVIKAGPDALSREDASAVVAALEARQASKLASLDGRGGNLPTQTLERVEGLLKDVASGRHGDDLAASAKNLEDSLQKWKSQDAARLAKEHGVTPDALADLRNSLRKDDGAWHGVEKAAESRAAQAPQGPADAASTRSQAAGPAPAAQAPVEAAAQEVDVAAVQRFNQTEMAAGKLAGMLANPAGSFTNRDKTWNERNVDAAVEAVMRVDVEAARTMTVNQRNQIAAYAAWIADNANSGRLPGFAGAEGQARAKEVTERATALVGLASGKMPAAVTAQIAKADRMVGALQQRSLAAPRRAQAAAAQAPRATDRSAAGSARATPAAASAATLDGTRLARDIGHAVFKEKDLSEPYAKYLLKNAGALTPDALKPLSSTEKAQAVVGLAHLVREVRDGALGEFKELPAALQRHVLAAQSVANNLHVGLSDNSSDKTAVTKAYLDLQSPSSPEKAGDKPAAAAPKANEEPSKPPVNQGAGRSLER